MRRQAEEIRQVADLVDRNLLAGFFAAGHSLLRSGQRLGLDETKIGVRALLKPVTGRTALAAHAADHRFFTQEGLGEVDGEVELAYSLWPFQQQCMRQPGAQSAPALPQVFLPWVQFFHFK